MGIGEQPNLPRKRNDNYGTKNPGESQKPASFTRTGERVNSDMDGSSGEREAEYLVSGA